MSAVRFFVEPDDRFITYGFRCAHNGVEQKECQPLIAGTHPHTVARFHCHRIATVVLLWLEKGCRTCDFGAAFSAAQRYLDAQTRTEGSSAKQPRGHDPR